jgi:hypothetical protein
MRWTAIAALGLFFAGATEARSRPPLHDPVALNIGLGCQWKSRCIRQQQKAMKRALKYVEKYEPPNWRVHMCNRNASRRRSRIDWVGFNNCIRNAALRPPQPARPLKKRRPRVTT